MRVRVQLETSFSEDSQRDFSLEAAEHGGFEYEIVEREGPAGGNLCVELIGDEAGIKAWMTKNSYDLDAHEFVEWPVYEVIVEVDGALVCEMGYDPDELKEADVGQDVRNAVASYEIQKNSTEFDLTVRMENQDTDIVCRKLESDEDLADVQGLPEHWRDLDWHRMTQSPCLWGDDVLIAVSEDLRRGYRVFDGWCATFDREKSDHEWKTAREFFELDIKVGCGEIEVETMGCTE